MDEMLRSSQQGLQEIFQSFNDIAWSADPIAWKTLFLTPSAEVVYGRPVSDFFDNPDLWRSLIHPDDRDRVESLIPLLFSTGRLNLEYQIVRPSGEVRWLYHRLCLIRDANGEALRIDGMATVITDIKSDVTERKQAEAAIASSERQYRNLVETSQDFIWSMDVEGYYTFVNPAVKQIHGYDPEEMIGRPLTDFVPPKHIAKAWEGFDRVLNGESLFQYEITHLAKDGRPIHLLCNAIALVDEQGQAVGVTGTASDITQRKQSEEILYRREQEFRALVENSPDIIARLDHQLRHLYVNPVVESATGIPPQTLIGKTHQDLGMPQEKVAVWSEALQFVFLTGQERIIETDFLTPSGLKFYQIRIVPEFNPDGTIGSVLTASRDITERKLAEEALHKSEGRFRNLVETTSDWVWEVDEDLVYTYVSPKVSDLLGYAPQEVEGMTPCDLMPVRERQRMVNFFSQLIAVQEPFSRLENTNIHRDGYLVVMETSGVPVFDADGKFCGYHGISRDMTDRKRMEEALRESQQKYQTLFEILPIGISITDEAGNILEANPASEQILGLSTAEQTRRKYDAPEWSLLRPDGTPMPTSEFASVRALIENRVIKNCEMGMLKSDGKITWLSVTAAPIPLPGYGVAIAYTDISDAYSELRLRKQAEETLHQSQHFIQKIADTTPHIIYLFDLSQGRTVYINQQVFEVLGYTVEDVYAGGSAWLPSLIHPDDLHFLDNASNRFASLFDHEFTEVLYRLQHKNGEWRWIETREVVFTRNADGSPMQILGSVKDITERKQVEETLRLQAERERLMGAIAQRIRQSLNLDEILNTTVEEVRQLLQNDRVLLFKLCDDNVGRVVTESVAPGLPATVGMEFPDEVFPKECYQYYCQGLPRIVPDIASDEFAPCLSEFLQQLGVKSKLVIPILGSRQPGENVNGCSLNSETSYQVAINGFTPSTSSASPPTSLWGVMTAHDCSGLRQWQQWEIDLLCSLATQIGIAIQQSELYLQLEAQLSELQQAEAALQIAKEAAEVANRAKSEFLANMSHELRTPLNGILGYAQILQKDTNLIEEQQNSLSIIHQCGEHLLTLIEDILDLSKIEAQKMELSPAEFHLLGFLKSLTDLFRMHAQQKDISFTYDILSPLPDAVIADKKRLRQILFNLLSNAVKFTDKGGVTFRVGYVGLETEDWEQGRLPSITHYPLPIANIRFQVEDTGIGIQESKLAEIFLPFHQVSDRAHAFEGTGLGLAISQKLVQMMGSEIQVRSTLGQGSVFWFDLDLPPILGWHQPNPTSDRPIIGYKGRKRQVLIVDDHQVNRSFFREMLEFVGFEVIEAVDGQDGLNKAIEFKPDVILMDCVMPVLDGLEATRRLRQLPQLNDAIIIGLSANIVETTTQGSLAAGCHDFLSKPVQTDRLLDAIARHLGLEWIYEEKPCSMGVEPNWDGLPLVLPPPSAIAILSELIKIGDIAGILDQAEQLEKMDDKLVPFAILIHQLAKGFKVKQLREIIQQYLADSQ